MATVQQRLRVWLRENSCREYLAVIVINTYQRPVRLIIPGSGGLMSTEGTTQGDPLAMAMYALAVTPLIYHLHSSDRAVSQVWYADDATGVGECAALRKWWDALSQLGPLFSYIPNASKTYLVVKDKYVAAARRAFSGTGVVISADGQIHLGAAIDHRDYTATYVTSKVQAWCNDVKRLADSRHYRFLATLGGGYSSIFYSSIIWSSSMFIY